MSGKTITDKICADADRTELGESHIVWLDITDLLVHAIPSIKDRVFDPNEEKTSPDYETVTSTRLLHNADSLLQDLQRMTKVLALARNILTIGSAGQSAMAWSRTDTAVAELVRIIIQITSRAYVPDNCTREDEQNWRSVIDASKKLLVTSLQVFSNFCVNNEHGVTSFWLLHLDTASDQLKTLTEWIAEYKVSDTFDPLPNVSSELYKAAQDGFKASMLHPSDNRFGLSGRITISNEKPPFEDYYLWFHGKSLLASCKEKELTKTYKTCQTSKDGPTYKGPAPNSPDFSSDWNDNVKRCRPTYFPNLSFTTQYCAKIGIDNDAFIWGKEFLLSDIQEKDLRRQLPPEWAEAEAKKRIKKLLKKLDHDKRDNSGDKQLSSKTNNAPEDDHDHSADDDSTSDGTGNEDDVYDVEDHRGLFTEIPVILGPGEIEVLPMIIQAGIMGPDEESLRSTNHKDLDKKRIKTNLRCQLLLTSSAGRDLLRELFIYVAAWDPREDDLYYGLMENILSAFLRENMMVYAWDCLREHQDDPVHPGQVMMIRLLTSYFLARWESTLDKTPREISKSRPAHKVATPFPTKNERVTINVFIAQFRREVIPQACSLVYLQGEIRRGSSSPEDFPFNFWEMERIYDSLYAYLQFLIAASKSSILKKDLTAWVIIYDLVSLLNYLHDAIPRSTPKSREEAVGIKGNRHQKASETPTQSPQQPVAVERPYDVDDNTRAADDQTYQSRSTETSPEEEEEPWAFEWRDIKNLIVELLSNLAYHNLEVQHQLVGKDHTGKVAVGLNALVKCCFHDDFNPYLPQAAYAALKFAVNDGDKIYEVFGTPEMRNALKKMTDSTQGMDPTSATTLSAAAANIQAYATQKDLERMKEQFSAQSLGEQDEESEEEESTNPSLKKRAK
jgi:palmitoyltransferase